MKRQFLAATAGLIVILTTASPALASVTYLYGGSPTPTNSRDGGIVSYIDQHAPVTFAFTVATPLATNLSAFDIKASILSWTASGGKAQSTVGSSDINAYLNRVRLYTDGAGNITSWNIFGSANIAALPSDDLEFYFDSVSGPHDTLSWYPARSGITLGRAVSVSTAGSLTRIEDVPGAVPEPSTWALMLVGFGAAGIAIRSGGKARLIARFLSPPMPSPVKPLYYRRPKSSMATVAQP